MTDLSLIDTRAELKAALEAKGYLVHNGIPHHVDASATVAMLTPADPYLSTEGVTYGTWLLHLEVWLGFQAADNDAFSDETDPRIVQLIADLPARWAFKGAAAPFSATDLGGLIVCRIRIDTLVTR
jgi:hypothetical protein